MTIWKRLKTLWWLGGLSLTYYVEEEKLYSGLALNKKHMNPIELKQKKLATIVEDDLPDNIENE